MKRKLVLIIASILVLSQTGCGESLMLEDATNAVADSSVSDSDSSQATPTPRQPSGGAATIIGQLSGHSDESSTPETPDSGSDVYMADFVNSTNKDVVDLIPYEIMDLDPDRDEESDTIQLRINEDSKDHKLSSLRFWIDGTINDFVCDAEEYDTFRGAYVCDLNYTDNLSNIITVFTSSRTGRHQTTLYSYHDDVVTLSGSYGGFIDFLSIDGAGDFSITEATDIKTSEYGTMYVRKNFQTKQTYSYDVNENIQEALTWFTERQQWIDNQYHTLGIRPTTSIRQPSAVYSITGQRIGSRVTKPGIYIINGKKILISSAQASAQ